MPDAKPSPSLFEYKEVIAPIHTEISDDFKFLTITNRYDFNTFINLEQEIRIINSRGETILSEIIDISDLAPRTSTQYKIPSFETEKNTYY
jgi:hypothetical protein